MVDKKVILDLSGENPPLEDFLIVTSEVGFLQNDGRTNLWVTGQACNYARAVYESRNVSIVELDSPRSALRGIAGPVTDELDLVVLKRSLQILESEKPKTLAELIFHLTTDDFWILPPSQSHAAKLLVLDLEDELIGFGRVQLNLWRETITDPNLGRIYQSDFDEHESVLRDWLFNKRIRKELGEYPEILNGKYAELLRMELGQQLRSSKGSAISEFPKSTPNKKVYGKAIVEYFSHNPSALSADSIAVVSSLLSSNERAVLEGLLPQSDITPLSKLTDVDQALLWVTDKYLPFRAAQAETNECHESDQMALSFAEWMLENYPALTSIERDESPLNIRTFYTVERLSRQYWVLWVVVDGLSFMNHKHLVQLISSKSSNLRAAEDLCLLSILPTITEKAKYGLTTGKFPQENSSSDWNTKNNFYSAFPNGVYAGNSGMAELADGLKREIPTVCYWNYTKIDKCHHDYTQLSFLKHEIDSQLHTLANHINHIVSTAYDINRVAVVVCTDHGQLTARCNKLDVGVGDCDAQGRTLLYKNQKPVISDAAFVKSVDGEMVDLNPKSFRLSEPTTVALKSTYFVDLKGNEFVEAIGVHGGLYPEEVVVGMTVLTRQPSYQTISATITGDGESGRSGLVRLSIDNPNSLTVNPLSITVEALNIEEQGELLLAKVGSHTTLEVDLPIDQFPQPTAGDDFPIRGTMNFEFGDGTQETCAVSGSLNCKSMYKAKNPSLLDRFKK